MKGPYGPTAECRAQPWSLTSDGFPFVTATLTGLSSIIFTQTSLPKGGIPQATLTRPQVPLHRFLARSHFNSICPRPYLQPLSGGGGGEVTTCKGQSSERDTDCVDRLVTHTLWQG